MILIIDNYDSFVYNIAQYVGELGWDPLVYRNDKITLSAIEILNPSHIILSPGPCTPLEAGISNDVIRHFGGKIPMLGICLGHQCIGHVYGGQIIRADVPTHGKSSTIYHDGRSIFKNLPNPFEAARYHSLIIENSSLSSAALVETAHTSEGIIMGIRHKEYVMEGIQFHPESILTGLIGFHLLENFLDFTQPAWI